MSDAPPPPDAGRAPGRSPLTPAAIDKALADFRRWLEEIAAAPPPPPEPDAPAVDLSALVGAFTALRHDVTLQTKAARAQSEQLGQALAALQAAPPPAPPEPSTRPLLQTLVDLTDGLLLAERELTTARDSIAEPTRTIWGRLFSPARRSAAALTAARQRISAAVTGLQMTLRRVERALAQHGLEPVAALGEPFDPETMEVLEAVAAVDRRPGEVVEEVRRGYRHQGRVFRYAQVRVAK